VVVGPAFPLDNRPSIAAELARNGEVVASATGAAASGHLADGVVWLAAEPGLIGEARSPVTLSSLAG
jgi:2-keto-4-pentenoate hydratase